MEELRSLSRREEVVITRSRATCCQQIKQVFHQGRRRVTKYHHHQLAPMLLLIEMHQCSILETRTKPQVVSLTGPRPTPRIFHLSSSNLAKNEEVSVCVCCDVSFSLSLSPSEANDELVLSDCDSTDRHFAKPLLLVPFPSMTSCPGRRSSLLGEKSQLMMGG